MMNLTWKEERHGAPIMDLRSGRPALTMGLSVVSATVAIVKESDCAGVSGTHLRTSHSLSINRIKSMMCSIVGVLLGVEDLIIAYPIWYYR
jgi:hypothetical protein